MFRLINTEADERKSKPAVVGGGVSFNFALEISEKSRQCKKRSDDAEFGPSKKFWPRKISSFLSSSLSSGLIKIVC